MPGRSHVPLALALAFLFLTATALGADDPDRMLVSPQLDQRCNIDAAPAATLLIPYFTVDLDTGRNVTTFTVTNADSAPHLARVTLWTNWALPTLSFDVYLAGYDVAVFNMIDLLTGKAFRGPLKDPDGPGPLSADNMTFPDCASQVVRQGILRPLYFNPKLRPFHDSAFEQLIRAHRGHVVFPDKEDRWGEVTPLIWAIGEDVEVATGYVTIDVVNRCSGSFPSDPDYFVRGGTGIASNENVLLGEYMIYEPAGGRAVGDTAVHIRADATAFAPGDYTFYGRYVDGNAADGRQPLGTSFASRFITDLGFVDSVNTYLLVWRDTKHMPGDPPQSQAKPAWYPLDGDPMLVFDETSDLAMMRLTGEAPLATQSVDLDLMGTPFHYGWLKMELNHRASDLFGGAAQGWVTTLIAAGVQSTPPRIHIGTGCRAFRLKSPCDYR